MSVDTAKNEICQINENQCSSERNEERKDSEENKGIKRMKNQSKYRH